jgi:hypothetical protein
MFWRAVFGGGLSVGSTAGLRENSRGAYRLFTALNWRQWIPSDPKNKGPVGACSDN